MKKILIVGMLLVANQVLACIGNGDLSICPGDLVYKGSEYSKGAIVVGVNPYQNTVTVKSVYSGSMVKEIPEQLDLVKGCVDSFCVNDFVYKGNELSKGATVLAVNPHSRTVTVKSVYSGNLEKVLPGQLDTTNGCLGWFCIDDLVYKGSDYVQGAVVIGINYSTSTITVKSVYSGSLEKVLPGNLYVTRGCLAGICVGDLVYKGNEYTKGARVLAINPQENMLTVKSVYSGALAKESPFNLDVTDFCVDYGRQERSMPVFIHDRDNGNGNGNNYGNPPRRGGRR